MSREDANDRPKSVKDGEHSIISKWYFSKPQRTPSSSSKGASCSKAFVIMASFQMVIVSIFQVLIITNGGGDGRRLPQFIGCLDYKIQIAIKCSEAANWNNVTIPSFGKDAQVYIGFIIALTVYNALLCFYALFGKHFLELIAFLVVNFLTMIYSVLEVYEFRPFEPNCKTWTVAGGLSLGSTAVLLVFTVLFVCMSLCMYRDFGWKVYKDVDCNHQMRKYYQWFEAVSSGVKLLILFTVVFSVAQLTLLLSLHDVEFELTIILAVVSIVSYFVVQLTIRYNSLPGYLAIAFVGVLLIFYYMFKIYRFGTESCPICPTLKESVVIEYQKLGHLMETCTNTSNVTLDTKDDRSIEFENLIIFASVNLVTAIVVLAIFIRVWFNQPGSKLMEHFAKHPYWISKLLCYQYPGGSDHGGSLGSKIKKKVLKVLDSCYERCCGVQTYEIDE